nr:hypothetical protein [Tanacetum cinerariifolium]
MPLLSPSSSPNNSFHTSPDCGWWKEQELDQWTPCTAKSGAKSFPLDAAKCQQSAFSNYAMPYYQENGSLMVSHPNLVPFFVKNLISLKKLYLYEAFFIRFQKKKEELVRRGVSNEIKRNKSLNSYNDRHNWRCEPPPMEAYSSLLLGALSVEMSLAK